MRPHIPALLALAACAAPPLAAAPAPATPAASTFAWMEGRWVTDDGLAEEIWIATPAALIGVALDGHEVRAPEWEALAITPGAVPTYVAMPGGASPTRFALRGSSGTHAEFENPEHDFPKTLAYTREGDRMRARVAGDATSKVLEFAWSRRAPAPAAELEEADRRFDADSAARGVEAWVEAFDPDEGTSLGPKGSARGRDAIRARMTAVLAETKLRWKPIASGWAPGSSQGLGFTVGRYTARTAGKPDGHGTYVTIWVRDGAGRPRIRFDTGFPDS